MFIVKFMSLREHTVQDFEYESLLDALTVVKETNLGSDRTHIPAMTTEAFNEKLLELLLLGSAYGGPKSPEYPEGEYVIRLIRREDNSGLETVVYNALPMPPRETMPEGKYGLPYRIPHQNQSR
jgi:hypothetical protein